MQGFKCAVGMLAVLSLSACGPEAEPQDSQTLAAQSQRLTTGTSQGCSFTISSTALSMSPPYYRVDLTRAASATCTADTVTLGYSYTTPVISLAANDLGVAVSFAYRGSPSPAGNIQCKVKHVAPDTLSTVRDTDLVVNFGAGNVNSCSLSISGDGTTLTASGTKTGPFPGQTGTGGSYYIATYANFFTSTTPPTYVSI
ncbi:hypothetical protein DRW03_25745 [Corallococcus sp. H22C18031201]|nr:hypothetical protein DRW03_25745 [Corallococcus sp. H22C18031201]